ncbi:hypothetical protein [Polyangium fumosum]|uniref:Uncharacterized protein n=1 Tax=Polyangium fumosum TaxID=889272 RepID=A0A4U1I675_9BACT|nr:hypothetical protein [Polyangium fumosum]TKC88861.1 hypothetical protein E8A74_51490 [Polyangium fumosum]
MPPWYATSAEAGKYHLAIEELDALWASVQAKYHAFAFPEGSIAPGRHRDTQERLAEFNNAMELIKRSPATAVAISLYAIVSMVRNGSSGPLTADQQDTFLKILTIGSGLEGVATGLSAGVAASRARAQGERTEGQARKSEAVVQAGERAAEQKAVGLPNLPRSGGASAQITTTSRISEIPYAINYAKAMSEHAQRDVDSLLRQVRAGNLDPGSGTRPLGGGFFELRGRNAGRVIIKQTGAGSFDIVGKFQGHARGDDANSIIIKTLMKKYTELGR